MNEILPLTATTYYHIYENRYCPRYGIIAAVEGSTLRAVTLPFCDDITWLQKLVDKLNKAQVPLSRFKTLYLSAALFSFSDSVC